jgi:DNA repair photolyase
LRIDEKELKTDLGSGNFIFVGSGTDMWAEDVPEEWIRMVLDKCTEFYKNKYLFQSKDPYMFSQFIELDFMGCILATTLETNRDTELSTAPSTTARANSMAAIHVCGLKTMVTVEPIVDFDVNPFAEMIIKCQPEWVNIGADSKGHGLPEPSGDKIRALISELEAAGIEVKQKDNLRRLLK